MGLINTYRFIANHPLTQGRKVDATSRWMRWQVGSRVLGWPVAVPFVNDTRLLVRPGMTGATGNVYCGLHEYEDMAFVLHVLRPGDLFVGIGANIGSYTVLASATGADAISFGPVPSTFEALLDNIHLNRLDARVVARNQAVGKTNGSIEMTVDQDTTNRAVRAGEKRDGNSIVVPVVRLDDALQGAAPVTTKIDVEGFETEVLAGATATLASPQLQAVIMEQNGSGALYGFDEDGLHQRMLSDGFRPCRYEPNTRRVADLDGQRGSSGNTLYLRHPHAAQAMLGRAQKYRVTGIEI